ncbi:MAG: VWA domain-containing protein [Vicinamibacterales bacterium]
MAKAVVATIAAGATVLHGAPQPPPQTFRTSTDAVLVDVAVRDGGRTVTGLRAEDFILTDNGVRQRIESIEATAVPIDLTLVVDVSGDPSGRWTPRVSPAKAAAEVEAQLADVRKILRPDDRMRVFAIERNIQQVAALAPVSSLAPFKRMEIEGLSALYDTLAAALLQPVEPARRHVVIAATKGRDTISSIDASAVRTIAERSDALFHLVMMETASDNEQIMGTFQCNPNFMGLCWPTRRFWVPFQRRLLGPWPVHQLLPDGKVLEAAAEATGGGLHRATGLSVPTLTSTFKKTFEDFRSSYVLRYTAQGVPRLGWHTIQVTIPGRKSYTVRARKGYGIEEMTSPPARTAVPPAPRTLAELTLAYEAAGYRAVGSALETTPDPGRLIGDFEKGGNPWPAVPRREAAFALELAEPGAFSTQPAARTAAHELLERFSRLVRQPLEPDVFERYWHFAALTLLEGTIRPAVTQAFVDRALERFPDEPRFVLSRAIVTDQRWVTGGNARPGAAAALSRPDATTVQRQYEAAVALPGTAAEARIRLAWFLHLAGRQEQALAHLTGAEKGAAADPWLQYLRLLFLGHVLRALERLDESVEAYRGALAVIPGAQSARVALMNARLLEGHRVEAEALAEQVQSERDQVVDPWWVYWQGQYRLHPQAMARVRELIK